jgi:RNA polymerase sigma-70 factor (ECF subfamily)
MPDLSDDELVGRCQAGSDDAFAELVTRYRGMVFGLIARSVGDRSAAEDLAQDVFLRVHRGLPYFKGRARLSTWIYRITLNVCLQERSGPKVLAVQIEDAGDSDRPPLQIATRDRQFGAIELRDRLGKALARLPPQYRVLVAAHYMKGMPYEQLAEVFGLPLGTVKTHLHRAKRQLRRLLEGELR